MIYIARKRYEKILEVLRHRQPSIALLAENLQDPHNLSAIARTCDAIGLMHLWTISYNRDSLEIRNGIAQGAGKWLEMKSFEELNDVHSEAKKRDMQLVCTNFSDRAVDYRSIDYTKPTLIMMGQEGWGASEKAQEIADHHVLIPMMGMVQSRNVSVASALLLYEVQRQRMQAGMYNSSLLEENYYKELLFRYCAPKIAQHYKKQNLAIPDIEEVLKLVEEEELDGNHFDGRDQQRIKGRKRNTFDPNS